MNELHELSPPSAKYVQGKKNLFFWHKGSIWAIPMGNWYHFAYFLDNIIIANNPLNVKILAKSVFYACGGEILEIKDDTTFNTFRTKIQPDENNPMDIQLVAHVFTRITFWEEEVALKIDPNNVPPERIQKAQQVRSRLMRERDPSNKVAHALEKLSLCPNNNGDDGNTRKRSHAQMDQQIDTLQQQLAIAIAIHPDLLNILAARNLPVPPELVLLPVTPVIAQVPPFVPAPAMALAQPLQMVGQLPPVGTAPIPQPVQANPTLGDSNSPDIRRH